MSVLQSAAVSRLSLQSGPVCSQINNKHRALENTAPLDTDHSDMSQEDKISEGLGDIQ